MAGGGVGGRGGQGSGDLSFVLLSDRMVFRGWCCCCVGAVAGVVGVRADGLVVVELVTVLLLVLVLPLWLVLVLVLPVLVL